MQCVTPCPYQLGSVGKHVRCGGLQVNVGPGPGAVKGRSWVPGPHSGQKQHMNSFSLRSDENSAFSWQPVEKVQQTKVLFRSRAERFFFDQCLKSDLMWRDRIPNIRCSLFCLSWRINIELLNRTVHSHCWAFIHHPWCFKLSRPWSTKNRLKWSHPFFPCFQPPQKVIWCVTYIPGAEGTKTSCQENTVVKPVIISHWHGTCIYKLLSNQGHVLLTRLATTMSSSSLFSPETPGRASFVVVYICGSLCVSHISSTKLCCEAFGTELLLLLELCTVQRDFPPGRGN